LLYILVHPLTACTSSYSFRGRLILTFKRINILLHEATTLHAECIVVSLPGQTCFTLVALAEGHLLGGYLSVHQAIGKFHLVDGEECEVSKLVHGHISNSVVHRGFNEGVSYFEVEFVKDSERLGVINIHMGVSWRMSMFF